MRNDVVNNMRLDVNREKNKNVIYVRVGDIKTRIIHFTIVNKGVVINLEDVMIALITINKPDGTHCYNDLVRSGNELQYTITSQSINVPGECECTIELTFKDGSFIGIPGFSIMVYEKYLSDKVIESTNEYKGVTAQVVLASELAETASKAAEQCKASEEIANGCVDTTNALLGEFRNDADAATEELQRLQIECEILKNECEALYQNLVGMGKLELGTSHTTAYYGDLGKTAYDHSQSKGNPHVTTYSDVGADQAGAAQSVYENAIAYTDKAIADLINGAPNTLDTLREVADAMLEHEEIVAALEAAIGSKADATETSSLINQLDARVDILEDNNGYPIS